MNEDTKQALLAQFTAYLDGLDDGLAADDDQAGTGLGAEEADLYSVFVELTGLRNEVRTESRLVKEALDQFQAVFDTMRSAQAALERELKRAQAEAQEQNRAAVKPLLLAVLDIRDRLQAGLQSLAAPPAPPPLPPPPPPRKWYQRRAPAAPAPAAPPLPPQAPSAIIEGQSMTLRRLDSLLAERRVSMIEMLGRKFDPRQARAVATVAAGAFADGVVAEVLRPGFVWDEEILRLAEVIVARTAPLGES